MAKILVTGGMGYIGSHTIVALQKRNHTVISIDNLSNAKDSVADRIQRITGVEVENYVLDLRNQNEVIQLFNDHSDIDGLIHFAAALDVEESVREPLYYFDNNIKSLLHVLQGMKQIQAKGFIFSSSCTVYGEPSTMPVHEAMPVQMPQSPYGRTKQIGENMIRDIHRAGELDNPILLRYFNPAGAHESALIGEDPSHLSRHLVPIFTHVASGLRETLHVFGSDYPTRDGSCIRDYIHVMDIAEAHVLAIEYAMNASLLQPEVINLGTGNGVSVLEMIKAFQEANQIQIPYKLSARRAGDIAAIYANNDKAKEILGWQPTRSLEEIMRSAWEWEKVRSNQLQNT